MWICIYCCVSFFSDPLFIRTKQYFFTIQPGSPSTIFGYLREVAPITENQNATQIFDPDGVDVDSSDNVYVNDIGPNEIKKYDENGNFITKWGSMPEGG